MNYPALYEKAFNNVPLGLLVLNAEKRVVLWNDWLILKTHISESDAIGKTLIELFPKMNCARFDCALEQLFGFKAPQIISQILNQYLIPIELEKKSHVNFKYMQQHVEILPLEMGSDLFALIVIQDLTSVAHQRNVLMQMGKKFEDQTYHDPLTGVYNRRFLSSYLEKLISWSKHNNAEIGCVMMDIDFFKKINDQFGHEKGDEVIIFFITLLRKVVRPSDVLVRYGGEEFLLIISNATQEMMIAVSERILANFEKESAGSVGIQVTCSAGVAVWQPNENQLSFAELIERADAALYKAKNNGRNRVEW